MNIIVFSGAGLSAESGIKTFRDTDGLWNGYDVEEVATPEGFERNPDIVHSFYNSRRRELKTVRPNNAHIAISRLQKEYRGNVVIITQNIDDLLERAGCREVLHIHGELNKCRCIYCADEIEWLDDTSTSLPCPSCGKMGRWGSLRPAVVWFHEIPLHHSRTERELIGCDLFISIGTSGIVYPAAGFSQTARLNGARTISFNLEEPENIADFDQFIQGAAGETFSNWVDQFLLESL